MVRFCSVVARLNRRVTLSQGFIQLGDLGCPAFDRGVEVVQRLVARGALLAKFGDGVGEGLSILVQGIEVCLRLVQFLGKRGFVLLPGRALFLLTGFEFRLVLLLLRQLIFNLGPFGGERVHGLFRRGGILGDLGEPAVGGGELFAFFGEVLFGLRQRAGALVQRLRGGGQRRLPFGQLRVGLGQRRCRGRLALFGLVCRLGDGGVFVFGLVSGRLGVA